MRGPSPRYFKAIPLLVVFFTGLVFPAFSSEDFLAMYRKAMGGDPEAQFQLGIAYEQGKGILQGKEEAVKWFRKAAEQGHEGARYHLRRAHDPGKVVRQDNVEPVKNWHRKATEQADADAQYHLGVAYSSGTGVRRDYAEAVWWFRKAAERGHAAAQYSLGLAYSNGEGVRRDRAEAVWWFRKAAEQGHAGARTNLEVAE